jgi:hypothetical protein
VPQLGKNDELSSPTSNPFSLLVPDGHLLSMTQSCLSTILCLFVETLPRPWLPILQLRFLQDSHVPFGSSLRSPFHETQLCSPLESHPFVTAESPSLEKP